MRLLESHTESSLKLLKKKSSFETIKEEKPKHKNYLVDLRKSKIVKRDNKDWQNILQNKNIGRVQDKFEIMKAELEKHNSKIRQAEALKRNKAEDLSKTRNLRIKFQ